MPKRLCLVVSSGSVRRQHIFAHERRKNNTDICRWKMSVRFVSIVYIAVTCRVNTVAHYSYRVEHCWSHSVGEWIQRSAVTLLFCRVSSEVFGADVQRSTEQTGLSKQRVQWHTVSGSRQRRLQRSHWLCCYGHRNQSVVDGRAGSSNKSLPSAFH